jgi:hypothetical protein
MTVIKDQTDFISKVCLVSNFIASGKTKERYLSDSRSFGDDVLDTEADEAQNYYQVLSSIFTDEEIKGMATLLNNLDTDLEAKIFAEVYNL